MEHSTGAGGAFTQNNKPYVLLFYEAFLSKLDAHKQERFYKTGYGREILNDKISESLKKI